MMKKSILKNMAGVVCIMSIMSTTAFAGTINSAEPVLVSNACNMQVQEQETLQNNIVGQYMTVTGTVSEVTDKENYYMIHVENDDMGMIFNVKDEIFVVDQKTGKNMKITDIVKEMKITAILLKNSPMTMSIPPQTSGAFGFVINNGDEKVNIEAYKELLPDVTIQEEVKEDKYVELRAEAESKGYKVEWTSNKKPIILTKNDMKIEVSIGSDDFTFTHRTKDIKPLDRMEQISEKLILENGKTMVSSSFIDALQ